MGLQEYDLKKVGIFLGVLAVIIIALAGTTGALYYYNKFRTAEKNLRDASLTSQESVQSLVEKVGKLIKLPEGELPTVATVSDLSRLKNQPFFNKAKVGDKVLLYMQAKKAFLYDPVNNVIVEVGPLVIPSPTPETALATSAANIAGLSTQAPQSPSPTLKPLAIAIYNGTSTSSLANNFEKDLTDKINNIKITEKSKSAKTDYAKSIIVDLTGKNLTKAEEIGKLFNLTSSALPSEEKAPVGADLLIILGQDRL